MPAPAAPLSYGQQPGFGFGSVMGLTPPSLHGFDTLQLVGPRFGPGPLQPAYAAAPVASYPGAVGAPAVATTSTYPPATGVGLPSAPLPVAGLYAFR